MNPYTIVNTFEEKVAEYAGSKYAVAVDSCTSALFLSMKYIGVEGHEVSIPAFTYKSVADAICHAGGIVDFKDRLWNGVYWLHPFFIVDGAKRFRKGMYIKDTLHCLSFHGRKILNIGEGGMILTNSRDAYEWLKLARFNGRHEKNYYEDTFAMVGWKANMSPEQAARGLTLMHFISDWNEDQSEDYVDLRRYQQMYDKYNEFNRKVYGQ